MRTADFGLLPGANSCEIYHGNGETAAHRYHYDSNCVRRRTGALRAGWPEAGQCQYCLFDGIAAGLLRPDCRLQKEIIDFVLRRLLRKWGRCCARRGLMA